MFDLWLQVTTLRLASEPVDQGRGHALAEPLCDPPRQRRANGTRWPDQTNEFVALARNICGALRYVALCGMWRSMVCGALWFRLPYSCGLDRAWANCKAHFLLHWALGALQFGFRLVARPLDRMPSPRGPHARTRSYIKKRRICRMAQCTRTKEGNKYFVGAAGTVRMRARPAGAAGWLLPALEHCVLYTRELRESVFTLLSAARTHSRASVPLSRQLFTIAKGFYS